MSFNIIKILGSYKTVTSGRGLAVVRLPPFSLKLLPTLGRLIFHFPGSGGLPTQSSWSPPLLRGARLKQSVVPALSIPK